MSDADTPLLRPPSAAAVALRARYERLQNYVGLDLLDLERGYTETPSALQAAGELVAAADLLKNEAKDAVTIAAAAAAERLRQVLIGGKEPPQNRIDSQLALDRDLQAARQALSAAIYEADLCQGLFRSLEVQSRLLGKASDMVVAGFLSPSALQDQRRAEIRAARVAADREDAKRRRRRNGDDDDDADSDDDR